MLAYSAYKGLKDHKDKKSQDHLTAPDAAQGGGGGGADPSLQQRHASPQQQQYAPPQQQQQQQYAPSRRESGTASPVRYAPQLNESQFAYVYPAAGSRYTLRLLRWY